MANTLTNFLIGIGLSTDDFKRGEKEVLSGVGSMRSQILQLGAVAGGAFGFKALTVGFADATAEAGRFTQVFGGTVEDIRAFGQALEQEGGSLASLMSQIENLERMRAMTPAQIGGLFAEAGIRGVDPSVILNAKSATDAYLALADVLERLSPKQRLPVADVFGLDEASIRLLSQGRDEVERIIERQREIRPLTDEMTEAGIKFNQQLIEFKNNVGQVVDEVSMKLVPALTTAFQFGNEFANLWREGFTLGEIAGETFGGGRLSATGLMGDTATSRFLDTPIGELTGQGGPLSAGGLFGGPSWLDRPITQLFSGDSGAMPTFDDPRTETMAREMLERQRGVAQQPVEVKVYNRIELDGQKIDQRIDQRTELQYNQALTEIESSNGG